MHSTIRNKILRITCSLKDSDVSASPLYEFSEKIRERMVFVDVLF